MIEQARFTYFSLGKAFEKQVKTIENQGEKQKKPLEDHGQQLVEYNELIKKDFNIDRDSMSHVEQKKVFNKVIRERSSEFYNLEKRINCNLIYK